MLFTRWADRRQALAAGGEFTQLCAERGTVQPARVAQLSTCLALRSRWRSQQDHGPGQADQQQGDKLRGAAHVLGLLGQWMNAQGDAVDGGFDGGVE
jgi:hypothetical protein